MLGAALQPRQALCSVLGPPLKHACQTWQSLILAKTCSQRAGVLGRRRRSGRPVGAAVGVPPRLAQRLPGGGLPGRRGARPLPLAGGHGFACDARLCAQADSALSDTCVPMLDFKPGGAVLNLWQAPHTTGIAR